MISPSDEFTLVKVPKWALYAPYGLFQYPWSRMMHLFTVGFKRSFNMATTTENNKNETVKDAAALGKDTILEEGNTVVKRIATMEKTENEEVVNEEESATSDVNDAPESVFGEGKPGTVMHKRAKILTDVTTKSEKFNHEIDVSGKISELDFLRNREECSPGNFPSNPFKFSGLLDGTIALPIPGAHAGTEVAIIGAGCAGMAAANLLMRLGLKPVIYELSKRIGGRTYSHPMHDENEVVGCAELGAMRIPMSHTLVFDLCRKWGIKWRPFPNPLTVNTTVNVYGHQLLYDAVTKTWSGDAQLVTEIQCVQTQYHALVAPIIAQWNATEGHSALRTALWKKFVKSYDNQSFLDVLVKQGWIPAQIELFGFIGIGSGGFNSFFVCSFLEIVRIEIQQLEVDQQLIERGTEQFPLNFWNEEVLCHHWGQTSVAKLCRGTLLPGVAKISTKNAAGIIIVTDINGAEKQFESVILTATPPAINTTININPEAFSPDVWSALRSIEMTASTKVFILTKTPFWEKPDCTLRMTLTDRLPRQIYLFTSKELGYDAPNGIICLSYAWASSSIKFNALSGAQRVKVCLDALEEIYGKEMRHTIEKEMVHDQSISICWENQYGYSGGFRMAHPGQADYGQIMQEQCLGLNAKWDNGLYLAGEAMSWYGLSGWIDGAIQTGLEAAISAMFHVIKE
jgi:monoamine oxidase